MLIERELLGISTTNSNDEIAPRKSPSEEALIYALDYSKNEFGAETLMIKLKRLAFQTLRRILLKKCQCVYISMFNFRDG